MRMSAVTQIREEETRFRHELALLLFLRSKFVRRVFQLLDARLDNYFDLPLKRLLWTESSENNLT